jgi:hypothetical protein
VLCATLHAVATPPRGGLTQAVDRQETFMVVLLKSVLAWAALLLVCINLTGLIVRGFFFSPPQIDAPTDRVAELFKKESRRMTISSRVVTFFALILAVLLIWSLYYYWNIWLAVAGSMLMVSRLPDLVLEIRNGRRVTRSDAPKGMVYMLGIILDIVALPIVWYALSGQSQTV